MAFHRGTVDWIFQLDLKTSMKSLIRWMVGLALIIPALSPPVFAGDNDPLFVNLTTEDAHRANMGIGFGKNQLERGHPLTIFLNDKGVVIGSKQNSAKFGEHQKMLADAVAKGATVLVCPMCMKQYGVKDADLLPGLKIGNPELTGGALFKENTKTLTW